MLTVATGRTWTCDCTSGSGKQFATVDENIAVQHMNGHFRRKESYRMVLTHVENGAAVVDDVRGAAFDERGVPETFTLEDLKRKAEEDAAQVTRVRHYRTFARITIRVHEEQIEKLTTFAPERALRMAIEASGFPPIRMFKGEQGNSNGSPRFPHYSMVIDSLEAAKREANRGKGRPVSKTQKASRLARALADLPEAELDKLERALGIIHKG